MNPPRNRNDERHRVREAPMSPQVDEFPTDLELPAIGLGHGTMESTMPPAQALLARLLSAHVLLPEAWEDVPPEHRDVLSRITSSDMLLSKLLALQLLTRYQVDTIRKGGAEDLILGNYRLLDVLGQGGMGTVYRAEHVLLRRQVALKVMARSTDMSSRLVTRFYGEARAVARLQHPHIVTCFDAGRHTRTGAGGQTRDYFVMELIPGQDLFNLVRDGGPLPPLRACDIFRQVSDALAEAHRHGLVHRDIKPSNVLVTSDGQAKVLDFGLARLPTQQMTEPGVVLGTIGYMAPEQARDPHSVDHRADLFSLGATLYWALTGRDPYPESGNPIQDLHRRFTTVPLPVRRVRPEVPAEVSDLVARLMEPDPEMRFPSARTVSAALTGFTLWLPNASTAGSVASHRDPETHRGRVLLVEDDPSVRVLMCALLQDQYDVREAEDGETALTEIMRDPPDLAVVDVGLPGLSGPELVEKVRAAGLESDRMKVLITSGELPAEALGGLSVASADDFISKPFAPVEFLSRVRALLMRRSSRSGDSEVLVAPPVTHCTRPVAAETLSLTVSRLLAETQLAADNQWQRMSRYVRTLCRALPDTGAYRQLKNDQFAELLAAVAPMYDIGLLGVPRHTLLKPGRLDASERSVVQTHCSIGAEVLVGVAQVYGGEVQGLDVAAEVARSHHERWDGAGYPDGLQGEEIPLAARVVSLAAVYEALRNRRPHRPPLNHAQTVKLIATQSEGEFDPAVVAAFVSVAPKFDQIHQGK
ncbi:protein kinase domain-containing protein [Gemmata obscuriglobus]|nr:protein kinase [Gemmata obscuriglobus]